MCPVSVPQRFEVLSEEDVTVDPQLKLASLSFWLNKRNFDSQQALLWCLSRTFSKSHPTNVFMQVCMCVLTIQCVRMCFSGCDEEPRCFLADLQDAEASSFFSCRLHPDNRVCGAYDKPLRQACRHLLDRPASNTYSKKGKHLGCNDSHWYIEPFCFIMFGSVQPSD